MLIDVQIAGVVTTTIEGGQVVALLTLTRVEEVVTTTIVYATGNGGELAEFARNFDELTRSTNDSSRH